MELFFFQFPIACVFLNDYDFGSRFATVYVPIFWKIFTNITFRVCKWWRISKRWEIFHHTNRPFAPAPPSLCSPMSLQNLVPKATPRTPEVFGGVVGGGGNGSIFPKGCPVGTRDPVAMVGFFIPRISEEIRNQDHLHLFCSNGLVKKPPDPTSFILECNIKKKTMFIHFLGSNPLPRMPVATITSCGEKNPSHRWLQRWHFFYLPNIGERWVSVLKIAHLLVAKNQHPMIAMSQLHYFNHFSIQSLKNRAQTVQKKSQWSKTSA